MRYVREVIASRELLANFMLREIRGKYRRTVFGQFWSLLNPLALMLIYTLVFGFVLRIEAGPGDPSGIDIFAIWLLCGLLPWTFLSNIINQGVTSLVENQNLIQKVYFPRILLPLSMVGSSVYNWAFEMLVLLIVLSLVGAFVLPWIPLVLVAMILLALFGAGVALMISIANVYFRDTQYLISIVLQMWFYLTPIIYPLSLVSAGSEKAGGILGTPITVDSIYQINPMVHFITVFRNLLYDNRWPGLTEWVICGAWAIGSFGLGLLVFRRNEKRLAEAL
jgi:lipopolysaccharide transport system permease protein